MPVSGVMRVGTPSQVIGDAKQIRVCGCADPNAAANILAFGIGLAAQRGAFGLLTPKTRAMYPGITM